MTLDITRALNAGAAHRYVLVIPGYAPWNQIAKVVNSFADRYLWQVIPDLLLL